MKINKLRPEVANQIAAGEVIERPASVVKELLENAIDANATEIQVDIEYGGVNRIKITDNGEGIHPDDLPLAIQAHATSKIDKLNDLYDLCSMGFRGEALASIASISKLTILSKAINQDSAYKLDMLSKPHVIPAARNQGTTIDVIDLFFNAPVRKKFLKSPRTEFQAIEALVKRVAMSHPKLAIQLSHNDKVILQLPAAQNEKKQLERMTKIMGKTFVDASTQVDVFRAGMHLSGYIAHNEFHRSQNDKQWLFLNRRIVKDKLLNHAIKQSYLNIIPEGRFPGCMLYLDVPSSEVDVNVHPTKHEVRFQQPRLVHDFLTSELTKVLSRVAIQASELASSSNERYEHYSKHQMDIREPTRDYDFEKHAHHSKKFDLNPVSNQHAIVKMEGGLFLVDMPKLYQNGLKNRIYGLQKSFESRSLLVPIRYQVPKRLDKFLECYQKQFKQVGIDIDRLSDDFMVIRTIPTALPNLNIQTFMDDMCQKMSLVSHQELLDLLIKHTTIPAWHHDDDLIQACYHRIVEMIGFDDQAKTHVKGIYKKLDEHFCRELLSE